MVKNYTTVKLIRRRIGLLRKDDVIEMMTL